MYVESELFCLFWIRRGPHERRDRSLPATVGSCDNSQTHYCSDTTCIHPRAKLVFGNLMILKRLYVSLEVKLQTVLWFLAIRINVLNRIVQGVSITGPT